MKRGDKRKIIRIRSRLSFSGWIYVLLCLLVGLAAVNSNNNVLFLITSLLLSLLFLSGLVALYNVSGLRVQAVGRDILTSNEPGTIMLRIRNQKRFSALVLQVGLEDQRVLLPVIGPGRHKDIFISWTPPFRGQPPLPPVRLTSSFPFGFVLRGGLFDPGKGPVVAPGALGASAQNLMAREQPCSHILRTQGSGEWQGIRRYRPGESRAAIVWRRLDWSMPAMGMDISRWPAHSFAFEHAASLVMDWEDPAYAHLDTEKRLSLFRSILDRALQEYSPWELRLPGRHISGNPGADPYFALHALALVEPLPGRDPD
ncbi:hypothetical protein [Desulfonatronospira sp.]|uniref:hypothetical protein n=1 Tax=Desulfonatronospira sp. TaxID=1962951 RepID=UPI0025B8D1AF|nr:hypothetical protein [Desulfonatronospira sp.]